MPISKIGRKEMIAAGFSRLMSALNQPSLNTSCVSPNDAPTLSRNPAAVFSGTHTDRNTAHNNTSVSPTTMMTNGPTALPSFVVTSSCTAVKPVTFASRLRLSCHESVSSRSRSTVCTVSGSSLAVVG